MFQFKVIQRRQFPAKRIKLYPLKISFLKIIRVSLQNNFNQNQ